MKKIWSRLICLALLAVLVIACFGPEPAASETAGRLTITIGNKDSKFDRRGIKVVLYQIGREDSAGNMILDDAFKNIDFTGNTQQQQAAILSVRKIIAENNVLPVASGETDANGSVTFTNLAGIYFGTVSERPTWLTVQDFVTSVPMLSKEGKWLLQVDASLKYEYETPSDTPSDTPSETPTEEITPPGETPTLPGDTAEPTQTPEPTPPPTGSPHKLIIHYIYADTGETAAPDHTEILWEGESYDVWSPIIQNYWYDIPEVAGVMPNHDMEYTVLYFTKKTGWTYINIDDYETALGIGIVQMHVGVCYE